MKSSATVANWTIRVSGLLLILLGIGIWTGRADQVIPIHEVLGFVLVLSLWTMSYLAARAGVATRWVVLAVAWGLVAPVLGLTQQNLVTGDWHWTIQILHLLIGVGAIGQGENLARLMREISTHRIPAV